MSEEEFVQFFNALSTFSREDWDALIQRNNKSRPPKNHAWLRNKNVSIETASMARARRFASCMTRFRERVMAAGKSGNLRLESVGQFQSIMKHAQATMRAMVSKDIIPEDDYNAHAHWFDVEGKWPIGVHIDA